MLTSILNSYFVTDLSTLVVFLNMETQLIYLYLNNYIFVLLHKAHHI